ncbi:AraC family transcriptional regulator [Alkalihalobacillus trypoxylicola]|uniref:HTH araC/xylS-type domain-containing protein n=1 Tax=Alkalihalobacillus trypoxylicola TaxID=519424 RepID=A0A161PBV4_9BACI|nr:AraC family transcriptional regulator [Alkalihalobacillus trypoxylicola]KYG29289.1 hypothetical protein AZF04_07120 [Alkalihalobacillus trypoxylicola]
MVYKRKKASGFDSEMIYILPEYLEEEMMDQPFLKEFYLTDIGYYPDASFHYRERKKGCESSILIYCDKGEGWIDLFSGNLIHIQPQTFFFIPAHTPHVYYADHDQPWSIYWFHIKGEKSLPLISSLLSSRLSIPVSLKEASLLKQLFKKCFDYIKTKPYSMPHHLNISQTLQYLISVLGIQSQENDKKERKETYIEEAIHYMEDQIQSSLSLDDIANQVKLSKQHLIQIFKEATGFPPIDYFLRLKIQYACHQLDLTNLAIKEIALMVGFSDPYYFSRMFKKIIGQSPTEYRTTQKG